MTILVAGATGNVGGNLVRELCQAGERVRALTRNPAAANLPDGVEVMAGDLTRPETMADALAGVDRMHLLTVHDPAEHEAAATVAELARAAGVRRATVMSGGHETHVVQAVKSAGIACTHLDPGEFMANTLDWAETIRAQGVVRAPFGGWTSAMIHEADIAAVAATALRTDGHDGRHYLLTGAEPIVRVEAVRIIGEAIGREIRFIELTPEQAREHWLGEGGYPPEVIDWFLDMGPDALENNICPESSIVAELTGRPARTFTQWAREHADDFR